MDESLLLKAMAQPWRGLGLNEMMAESTVTLKVTSKRKVTAVITFSGCDGPEEPALKR